MNRRPARALCVVVTAVALGATAAPAAAHSALQRSEPAGGERLAAAPEEVVLSYSEPPDPGLSRVEVYDRTGAPVEHGGIEPDAADRSTIRVELAPLDDGVYSVSWQALSEVDGHITRGAFSFTVGDVSDGEAATAAPDPEPDQSGPSPIGVTGRWVLYWGLALLLGWALSALVVFRTAPPGPRWVVTACWAFAVVGYGLIVVAEAASAEVGVERLLAASAGARLVRLAAALAAVGVAAAAVTLWRRSTVATGVLAVLTLAAMLAHAATGHAGAPTGTRWLNLSAQWLHLAAIGAWVGGLAWLLACMRAWPATDRVHAIKRFSTVATVSLALVVLTGTWRAVEGVGSFGALRSSGYGLALLLKLALVAPLVALGAVNRFRNVPAITRGEQHQGALRKAVRGELLFAAAVFGVTGVLAALPPPADIAAHGHIAGDGAEMEHMPEDAAIEVTDSDFATSVEITLRVEPGRIGTNRFAVRVADYDTGETVDAHRVALDLTIPARPEIGPTRVELEPADSGWWEAESSAVAQPARWRATVIAGYGAEGVEVPLEFEVGTDSGDADDEGGGGDEP